MRGTVKWFNALKGYGFLVDSETQKDVFVHYTQLKIEGYKSLHEDDIVNFELGAGKDGREQAVNVTPLLTMKMIEDFLKEDNLYVGNMKDAFGHDCYMVVDQYNVLQSSEYGMAFLDLAAFAGFDTEGLTA